MSGQILGQIGGAILGSAFGPVGMAIGSTIGGMIGSTFDTLPTQYGPRLDDLRPQTSEYGKPIPIVFGTVGMGGNVIWASDYVEVENKDTQGGKGGPSQTTITYSYFANFAVAFAEGECDIGRMWAGPSKRLIYDGALLEGGGSVRIYRGTEDQLPDPLIESYEGVGNVPAHRGIVYAVFEMFPMENDGNAIPFITAEVGSGQGDPPPPVPVSPITTPANTAPHVAVDPVTGWIWHVASDFMAKQFTVTVISDRDESIIWQEVVETPYSLYTEASLAIPPDGSMVAVMFQAWTSDTREAYVAEFQPGVANLDGTAAELPALSGLQRWGDQTGPENPIDPVTIYATPFYYWVAYSFTNATQMHLARFNRAEGVDVYDELFPGYNIGNPVQMVGDDQYLAVVGELGGGTYNVVLIDVVMMSVNAAIYVPYTGRNGDKPLAYDGKRKQFVTQGGDGYLSIDPVTGAITNHPLTLPDGQEWLNPTGLMYNATRDKYIIGQRGFDTDVNKTTLFIVEPDTDTVSSAWTYDVGDNLLGPMSEGAFKTGAPYILSFSHGQVVRLYIGGSQVSASNLGLIVANLSERAGLDASQYDVSALADVVDGYAIARQTTVRGAIDALRPAYYFDAVESGGKVKFVKRGGQSVADIDDNDLDAHQADGQPGDPLMTTRQMEVELPKVVNVNYLSAATDYEKATQTYSRQIGSSEEETTLDLPLVLSDTKGQEIAQVNAHAAWVQRLRYGPFNLPRKYSALEPTDIITVRGYEMMLEKVTATPGGVLACEAVATDSSHYTPHVIVTETVPTEKIVYVPGATVLELM